VLIGRHAELEACLRSIDDARPVVLLADAGIGKTTLLTEVTDRCRLPSFFGRGLASLSWMAYLPLETAIGAPVSGGDGASVAGATSDAVGEGVLVVDDLQWADDDTLRVIALLAGRVRLAGAVRTDDPAAGRATEALEAAGFARLEIPPLTIGQAEALLAARRPGLGRPQIQELLSHAGGNPLLLEQLSWDGVPSATLRISVDARLHRLPPSARTKLGFLALLGRPADRAIVGTGIDEQIEAGLVTETADGLVPRHSLLAEAAAAQLTDDERREIHASIAASAPDAGEAAVHQDLAGDRAGARASALAAADASHHVGQRARMLLIALRNGSGGPDDDGIRLRAADALVEAGEYREADRVAAEVRSDDPVITAETLLYRARAARGTSGLAAGDDLVRQGLALASGSRTIVEIRLLLEQVSIANWSFRSQQAVASARRALTMAKGTTEFTDAMKSLGISLVGMGSRDGITHLRLAVNRARRERNLPLALDAALHLVIAMKYFREWEPSLKIADDYRREAVAAGLRTWDVMFRYHIATTHLDCSGDLDRVVEIGEPIIDDVAAPARIVDDTIGQVASALTELGRLDDARALLARSSPREELETIFPLIAWTELLLADGDAAGAIETAREAFERLPADWNQPVLWLIRGWAELQLDREPPTFTGFTHDLLYGYVDALHGQVELARGRAAEAEGSFVAAVEGFRDSDIRAELHCRWAAGVAAARAGAVERAREHLLDVERRAKELGFVLLLAKIHASLRSLGVRRSAPRSKGAHSLSGREREVLHLVSSGLRTRNIAARLGIEPGTVDEIVRSASTKLNARSRIEAAARLAELEDLGPDPTERALAT